jgi:hypothetical protein
MLAKRLQAYSATVRFTRGRSLVRSQVRPFPPALASEKRMVERNGFCEKGRICGAVLGRCWVRKSALFVGSRGNAVRNRLCKEAGHRASTGRAGPRPTRAL